jgi:hypothetical protein
MLNLFCGGAIESNTLSDFPYAAQPIVLCRRAEMWQRVSYEIVGGRLSNLSVIGLPLPLEDHSFRKGDYVLSEPAPIASGSFTVVAGRDCVETYDTLFALVSGLWRRSRFPDNRQNWAYLRRSVTVVCAAIDLRIAQRATPRRHKSHPVE